MKLSYDLHIHSCLSPCGDDDATPGSIAGMATVIGLDAVALTDHNTCKNCPTFLAAAEAYGVTALPGMELTTSEEIHVLFYFRTLDDAMAFDRYVEPRIMPVPNRPQYFGNQILVNGDDEPCGTFDTLLISATDISFDEVFDLGRKFRGVAVPAHVDKSTTSLLSQLGFIPPWSTFHLAEIKHWGHLDRLREEHPYLQKCELINSSDAHSLTAIHEAIRFLEVPERSADALFGTLWRMQYGDEPPV